MKFGKTYMETMADPSFPEEWRNGALEYKHLKKLINGVVAELESIGLGADVLRELLIRPEDVSDSPSSSPTKINSLDASLDDLDSTVADESGNSSEQDEEPAAKKELTPAGKWVSDFSVDMIRRASSPGNKNGTHLNDAPPSSSRPREASPSVARSNFLDVPTSPKPRSYSHGVKELSTSLDDVRLQSGSRSRASFTAGSAPDPAKWAGIGRKDLAAMRQGSSSPDINGKTRASYSHDPSPGHHDWTASKWREEAKLDWDPSSNPVRPGRSSLAPPSAPRTERSASPAKHRWVEGKFGRRARAEYELGGTPAHPVPRIRLYIESPLPSDDEGDEDSNQDDAGSASDDASSRKSIEEQIIELPATPIRRFSTIPEDGPEGETREQKVERQSEIRRKRGTRSREIVIPLTADTQFLDTLAHALQNLSNIQSHQRDNFVYETESLCSSITCASSPFASKNDLYVWREIFGLWVDMQVFESQREKDRGELSIDESEARLKRFALELAKRGWIHDPNAAPAATSGKKGRLVKLKLGSEPSSQGLKNQASAAAIEDFLRLNFALLDVKKFQRVNVEAARKILKKHDKRTALTASNDLRTFMAQQEASRRAMGINPVGSGGVINLPASALQSPELLNGNSTALVSSAAHPSLAALLPSATTGILSESLPHILLSLVTTTLLPILPSVDDYSCAICTSVAWRPVRLDCSHLFCLRCLVKLQRQGKDDCPLCRAPGVVKSADKRNMDEESDKYLQTWFPKEVKEKNKDNEKERRAEELEALGFKDRDEKCVVM